MRGVNGPAFPRLRQLFAPLAIEVPFEVSEYRRDDRAHRSVGAGAIAYGPALAEPAPAETEPAEAAKPPCVRHRNVTLNEAQRRSGSARERLVELGSPNHLQDRLTDRPRTRCGACRSSLRSPSPRQGRQSLRTARGGQPQRVCPGHWAACLCCGRVYHGRLRMPSWTFSLLIESVCTYH